MSNKRDYYEVLGVPKNASKDDIKNIYRNLRFSIIPTEISRREPKRNLKKSQKPMLYYPTTKNGKGTIHTVM